MVKTRYGLPINKWFKWFRTISKLFYNSNQNTYGYKPWRSRVDNRPGPFYYFHYRKERHFISVLPNRNGKDYSAGAEASACVLLPGRRILFAGALLPFTDITFKWVVEMLLPLLIQDKIPYSITYSPKPKLKIRPKTQQESSITCSSFRNLGSLEGNEFDMIVICEAGDPQTNFTWMEEKMGVRVMNRFGSWIVQSTNDRRNPAFKMWVSNMMEKENVTYVGPEILMPGMLNKSGKAKKKNLDRWTSWDCPYIPEFEIKEAEESLDKQVFEEKFLGKFVNLKGKCIANYDPEKHIINKSALPWASKNLHPVSYAGVDFGANDETVLLVGTTVRDVFYILETWNINNKPMSDIVPIALEMQAKYNIDCWFCDWQKQLWLELEKAGLSAMSATKIEVFTSVLSLDTMFKNGRIKIVEGMNPLLEKELLLYDWSEKENKPIDKFNHSIDALRYLVDSSPAVLIDQLMRMQNKGVNVNIPGDSREEKSPFMNVPNKFLPPNRRR